MRRKLLLWLSQALLLITLVLPAGGLDGPSAKGAGKSKVSADVFTDNAVFQRDQSVAVWGKARPGAGINVTLGKHMVEAVADANGRWQAKLPPLPAGGPFDLVIAVDGEEREVIRNVVVGEVWLCAGQSNMEMPLRSAADGDREVDGAENPLIRLFSLDRASSAAPLGRFAAPAHWAPLTPAAARDFSAACYHFGRGLQEELQTPVGLIDASWGGSTARAWTSAEGLEHVGGYDELIGLNKVYTGDPDAAEGAWRRIQAAWWRENDAGVKANVSWADPAFDVSHWNLMVLPQEWEKSGIPAFAEFDGIAWFRRQVDLTAEQAKADAFLSLGPVDEWDTTMVNGVPVGETHGRTSKRSYAVPAEILEPGANTIAVRVLDSAAGGGFRGRASDLFLQTGTGESIPLAGEWAYALSTPFADLNVLPEKPWEGAKGVSSIYNGMIAPLTPYTIRGVAWYQGESERSWPEEYARLLPNLLADWRRSFRNESLPFLIVQLPSFGRARERPTYSAFARLREIQRQTAINDPDVELITTIDIGDRFSIHPANKREVGRRLSIAAMHVVYRRDSKTCDPVPRRAVRTLDGAVVAFDKDCRLSAVEAGRPLGFQLCHPEAGCSFVDAHLEAEGVRVLAPASHDFDIVRYCWSDSPICNLIWSDDLPVAPFELPLGAPK